MTPQPKTKTIGCWLVLDDKGDTWRVQCANPDCGAVKNYSRNLLTGFVTPRCSKCGGKVAGKPVEASKPPVAAVVPVQVVAAVSGPMPLIGQLPASQMEPDTDPPPVVAPDEPRPEPEPVKKPKAGPTQTNTMEILLPPVRTGPIEGTHWTVVADSGRTPDGVQMVHALCYCGNRRRVSWRSICLGEPGSCGCEPPVEHHLQIGLPGQKWGSLIVMRIGIRGGHNRQLHCVCTICGNERAAWSHNLKRLRPNTCHCKMANAKRDPAASAAMLAAAKLLRNKQAKQAAVARELADLDRRIHAHDIKLAKLRERKESLQSPPTVAQ